jgi:hypothetical protein
MMFADCQDVGLPRDSHFHCRRWMLPGVVVDLIPYTCRASGTPRPSESGHGSRIGFPLPKPTSREDCHGPNTAELGCAAPSALLVPSCAGPASGHRGQGPSPGQPAIWCGSGTRLRAILMKITRFCPRTGSDLQGKLCAPSATRTRVLLLGGTTAPALCRPATTHVADERNS